MIDQNSRWQIGCPSLITFLLVSLGLVPNLDRGRLVSSFPGVLEHVMVLRPLVGSGMPGVFFFGVLEPNNLGTLWGSGT